MPTRPGARLTKIPPEPLAWSLTRAAREFGPPKTTIGARLKSAKENADSNGPEFDPANFGGVVWFAPRRTIARVRAQADELELRTAILRNEFLNRAHLENVFGRIATAMVQIIRSSNLHRPSQDDLLTQLRLFAWPWKALPSGRTSGERA
jgi:hypothetical protein